jgi:PIN domain nuclease of toxin-antitoxin system
LHHAYAVRQLPWHHRDPFDRLLVAQSRLEGMTLITNDARLRHYEVDTLW